MNELEAKLRAVTRRMVGVAFLGALTRCLFYALCLIAALAVVDRLVYTGLPVVTASVGLLVACLPAAAAWTWLRRINRLRAAILADQKLGLKERLSSALALADSSEPMVPELLEDALRHVRRLDVTRAVPFRLPREARFMAIPLVCSIAVLSIMPQMDLLGMRARAARLKADQQEIQKQAENLERQIKKLKAAAEDKKLENLAALVSKMEMAEKNLKAPKADRGSAMLELAKLSDEIRKEKEKLGGLGEMQKMLGAMEPFKTELANALADGLNAGDLKQAANALDKLQNALKAGDLNADQIKELAKELEALAKGLDPKQAAELNKRLKELANAMKKAGQMPLDAADIKKMLDQMNMLDKELADLNQMLDQMKLLDDALADAKDAKDILAGKIPGEMEPPDDMGEMFGEAEFYKGIRNKMGFGPRAMGQKEAVDFKTRKAQAQLQKGQMLGGILFKGQPPKDAQALAEYKEIVEAASKEANEIIPKVEIPANRKQQVKHYFETVREEQPPPPEEK